MADLTRYPDVAADEIAWISRDEMIGVARVLVDQIGVGLIQMMENAGRSASCLVSGHGRVFGPTRSRADENHPRCGSNC